MHITAVLVEYCLKLEFNSWRLSMRNKVFVETVVGFLNDFSLYCYSVDKTRYIFTRSPFY